MSQYTQTSIQRTSLSDPFCSLYQIIHYIKCNTLSKSSKWELGFVHHIAKLTISRFIISRFECTSKSTYFSILQSQYYFQTCGQAALGMLCGSDPTNPHPSISLYCLSAASEKEDHHLAKLAFAEARIHPGKL